MKRNCVEILSTLLSTELRMKVADEQTVIISNCKHLYKNRCFGHFKAEKNLNNNNVT